MAIQNEEKIWKLVDAKKEELVNGQSKPQRDNKSHLLEFLLP